MTRCLVAVLGTAMLVLNVAGAGAASRSAYHGKASYYKMGKVTANGEAYRPHGLTAAHRSLRFGTKVRVTNLNNGRKVIVRINDRGPFIAGRIIDLSLGAAKRIGMISSGVARVKMEVLN